MGKERGVSAPELEHLHCVLARDLGVIGKSTAFDHVVRQCLCIAPHDITVLLVGETGTGKEIIARTIHYLSLRAARPFVPVDCAAIPETLFARELFGHVRGAFTDARVATPGLLFSAGGGTLFLDEIEALPLTAQGALLRLLDTHTWRPLGSPTHNSLDARIIAATNQDLSVLIEHGAFRKDLYYRLASEVCHIPPLRERREDIPALAQHFLARFSERSAKRVKVSTEAMAVLAQYSWPGNVRELQHCLHRAVLRSDGYTIRRSDLALSSTPESTAESPFNRMMTWREARLHALEMWEKKYLTAVLESTYENINEIAQRLCISRMQVYRLLKKHNLRRPH